MARLLRIAIIFVSLLCPTWLLAQPGGRVPITEIMKSIIEADSGTVSTFSGVEVSAEGLSGRNMNNLAKYLAATFPDHVDSDGFMVVDHPVSFDQCVSKAGLVFSKIRFSDLTITGLLADNLKISSCWIGALHITGNTISNSVEITDSHMASFEFKDNTVDYEVYMEKDSISGGDTFIENNAITTGELVMSSLSFEGSLTLGNNEVSGVLIENSLFDLPAYGEFNNYKLPGNSASDLYLTANEFRGDSTSNVFFNRGNYLNLDIRQNKFLTNVYFVENHVNERFFLVENEFSHHVSFEKFLFSETWNELYWNQLAGYKLRYVDYAGSTEEELDDEIGFKNLINIYKGLHTIFLSRGDLQSANACYSEMKQMQGKMLRHIFFQQGGFGNFLRWQLNVLLKIYTDHGTDPGLAVVVSFFVILGFAVLYLFFPSEWDRDSVVRLLSSYEKFVHRQSKGFWTAVLVIIGSATLTLVNAITLSINSFVTLGFGSIPTYGFARYLTIIEGFIGWFLLSIFTVALINQVLA